MEASITFCLGSSRSLMPLLDSRSEVGVRRAARVALRAAVTADTCASVRPRDGVDRLLASFDCVAAVVVPKPARLSTCDGCCCGGRRLALLLASWAAGTTLLECTSVRAPPHPASPSPSLSPSTDERSSSPRSAVPLGCCFCSCGCVTGSARLEDLASRLPPPGARGTVGAEATAAVLAVATASGDRDAAAAAAAAGAKRALGIGGGGGGAGVPCAGANGRTVGNPARGANGRTKEGAVTASRLLVLSATGAFCSSS